MSKKILFLGDSYRGDQERAVRRLHDLFAPAVKHYGVLTEICISECNRKSGPKNWMSSWMRSLKKRSTSILKGRKLENAAVIAFELSSLDKKYLDSVGIPWVNFKIHPIRFLDDLYFDVETSFVTDLSELELPDDYIQVRADVMRARYGFIDNQSSRRILIIGQTPIDKSLYFDGVFKKIPDYFDKLDLITQSFSGVDYRPHPYLTDVDVDKLITGRYGAGSCIDADFYRVLSSGHYGAVCGISSSVLHEASYFRLDSIALEKRAITFGRPVSYAALIKHSHLWLSGLIDKPLLHRKYDAPPPITENYLRHVFCSWAYVTKEDEVKELTSQLSQQLEQTKDQVLEQEHQVKAQVQQALAVAESAQAQAQELSVQLEQTKAQVKEQTVRAQAIKTVYLQQIKTLNDELETVRQELHAVHQANHSHWTQLEQSKQELHAVHQSNHHHWELAEQRQERINALLNSSSWRITAPLRWPIHQQRLLRHYGLLQRLKAAVKKGVRKVVAWVSARPKLKGIAKRIAYKFGLAEQLKTFVRTLNPIPAYSIQTSLDSFNSPLNSYSHKVKNVDVLAPAFNGSVTAHTEHFYPSLIKALKNGVNAGQRSPLEAYGSDQERAH